MRTRPKRIAVSPHIEHILRWNVVVALAIGTMLRASFEFSETESSRPDGLFVILFFLAMASGIVAILRLKRAIGRVPQRGRRVLIALASIGAHLILLQVIVDRFAP